MALGDADVGGDTIRRGRCVLLNGGLFFAPALRQRLLDVLQGWFAGPSGDWRPVVLDNDRLDLAVARGAAYYGMVRRGRGVRIAAGLARSYYIGVEEKAEGGRRKAEGRSEPEASASGLEGAPCAWRRRASNRDTTST